MTFTLLNKINPSINCVAYNFDQQKMEKQNTILYNEHINQFWDKLSRNSLRSNII